MKKVLFSVLALLIFSSALSLTAYEYLNDLNSKLKNGKVLSISFFDSEKQDFMTFELGENESSENNFELKEGYAYLILTNLSKPEYINIPSKGFLKNLSAGWNLVVFNLDYMSKYDIKQITCYNSEKRKYETYIPGFLTIPYLNGQNCFIYLPGKSSNSSQTPHAIYGEVKLKNGPVQATISLINLDREVSQTIECGKDGKFVFELLNLGFSEKDNLLIFASYKNAKASKFLSVDLSAPNQKIDLELKEQFNYLIILIPILIISILTIILIKRLRK